MKIWLTPNQTNEITAPTVAFINRSEKAYLNPIWRFLRKSLGTQDIFQDLAHPIRVFAIDKKHASRPWLDSDTYGHTKFIFYVCDKKNYKKGRKRDPLSRSQLQIPFLDNRRPF